MILALLACSGSSTPAEEQGPFYDGDPEITAVQWGCDLEESVWAFEMTTAQWTGGGRIFMAAEPDLVEEHRIRSTGAAADGSTDSLSLELDIVADWRDAVGGASTRWRCDDEESLTFLATVFTADGSSRGDCRVWGADPALWDETDIEGCETMLEEPDTGSKQ